MGWGNVVMCLSHLVAQHGHVSVHSSILDVDRGVDFCNLIEFVDEETEPVGDPKILINPYFYQNIHPNISKIVKPSSEVQLLIDKYQHLVEGVVRGIHIRRGAYSVDSERVGCHGKDAEGNIIPAYFADDAALKKFERIVEKSPGPVFIASDSKEVKEYFVKKYPDVRVYDTEIVVTYNCAFLKNDEVSKLDRLNCYVEWFLLSQCPKLYITGGTNAISTFGYSAGCYGLKEIEIINN